MKDWLVVKLAKAQIKIKDLKKEIKEFKEKETKYIDKMNLLKSEIRNLRLENEKLKNERLVNEKK